MDQPHAPVCLAFGGHAPESGAAKLLAANSRGGLLPLDQDGKEAEIHIAGRPLQSVHAADLNGDGKLEYTGLSIRSLAPTPSGLNLEGRELWHYDLPLGVAEKPTRSAAVAQ